MKSIDDCIDSDHDNFKFSLGLNTVTTAKELNENLFNDKAEYQLDLSNNKASATLYQSSSSQVTTIRLGTLTNNDIGLYYYEGDANASLGEPKATLSNSLCAEHQSPELKRSCSVDYFQTLGTKAKNSPQSKEDYKKGVVKALFEDETCGIENRATLLDAFLKTAEM